MKKPKPTLSRGTLARTLGPRGRVALAVVAFAPVQFIVSIRAMPVFCSGWLCSSGTTPLRAASAGRALLSSRHNSMSHSRENALDTTPQPATAPHSRIVALHGAVARGAAVSRRFPAST